MITMLLGGLWHGANWTFVVWGGLHGAYLIINHGWRAMRPDRALSGVPVALRRAISIGITFAAVTVAWVVFRAADLRTAGQVLAAMVGADGLNPAGGLMMPRPLIGWFDAVGVGALASYADLLRYAGALALVFLFPNTQSIIEGDGSSSLGMGKAARLRIAWRSNFAWGVGLGTIGAAALMTFTRVSEFLYFQF